MFYPPEIIEEIRLSNDILSVVSSYVSLKQKGTYHFGLCPFHNEDSPSFSVSPDEQRYYCFGCSATGNVISFVMAIENLNFISAIKLLADKVNYTLPEKEMTEHAKEKMKQREIIYEIHVATARQFYKNLISKKGQLGEKYLHDRNIKKNIQIRFGLGYSPINFSLSDFLLEKKFTKEDILKSGLVLESKNKQGKLYDRFYKRLMFPILDVQGKVIGFGGRSIDDTQPKYLNSPDTIIFDKSKTLYGLNFAKKTGFEEIIVTEGYLDVIALNQGGILNSVASLGTAFNIEHAKLLAKHTKSVVLMFDSDDAGTKAILRTIPILTKQGLKVRVLQLKGAKDPDEYINKFGQEALTKEVLKSDNHIGFQIELLKGKYNLKETEEKVEFTYEIAKVLSSLGDNILVDAYAYDISKLTNISIDSIKNHIDVLTDITIKDIKPVYKKQYENKSIEKGLLEAKRNIIYLIAKDYNVYLKLKDIFSPEELVNEELVTLLKVIYEHHENKKNIMPAELINHFDTIEKQQIVSNVFNNSTDFDDVNSLEKAINDQIKIIKKNNINNDKEKMVREKNINAIQELAKKERNLKSLNISLT